MYDKMTAAYMNYKNAQKIYFQVAKHFWKDRV